MSYRCRVYDCAQTSDTAGELCITHAQMRTTIREAQRGPITELAIRGFLQALGQGHGEGDATPGMHLAAPNRSIPKRIRRKRGAA
jgi:hypothetical protein